MDLTWLDTPKELQSDSSVGIFTVKLGDKELKDFIVPNNPNNVSGCLWLPEYCTNDTPIVLFGHGASGTRYQAPGPDLARALLKHNIASMAIDGPTHGLRIVAPKNGVGGKNTSSNTPGRAALNELINEIGYSNVVKNTVQDWMDSLNAIRKKTGFAFKKIGYFGLSMGSMFGIPLCAELPKHELKAAVLGLFGSSSKTYIKQCNDILCPVTYCMQMEDELFSRDGYIKMFDSIGSKRKRLHASPGQHGYMPRDELTYCIDFLVTMLTRRRDVKIPKTEIQGRIEPMNTNNGFNNNNNGVFAPGRIAVVTGAAGGIGFAVVTRCVNQHMKVLMLDINDDALQEAKGKLPNHAIVLTKTCDVRNEKEYQEARDLAIKHWGNDIAFVHLNAGVPFGKGTLTSSDNDWDANLDVNIMGVVRGLRTFVPMMKASSPDNGPCAIVATASWAGLFNAFPFASAPYVVAKAGCVLVMETLRYELRQDKTNTHVTAHVLCPGKVDTNMLIGNGPDRKPVNPGLTEKGIEVLRKGAMTPTTMAAILQEAIEANRFYALGYDDEQPLLWLKEMAKLKAEDLIMEREPLAHLVRGGSDVKGGETGKELRKRLREVKLEVRKGGKSRL